MIRFKDGFTNIVGSFFRRVQPGIREVTQTLTNNLDNSIAFVVPKGVNQLTIECYGGGGGGGGCISSDGSGQGGGGGGGAYAKSIINVIPGATYFRKVGSGGTGGDTNDGTALDGGDSIFYDTNGSTILVRAGGGGGGGGAGISGPGSGTTTANIVSYAGGNGSGGCSDSPSAGTSIGGGGGGGAGSGGNGGNASDIPSCGTPGDPGTGNDGSYSAGANGGGNTSAVNKFPGGNGQQGAIIIAYTEVYGF